MYQGDVTHGMLHGTGIIYVPMSKEGTIMPESTDGGPDANINSVVSADVGLN
jgi:hypothetical protein